MNLIHKLIKSVWKKTVLFFSICVEKKLCLNFANFFCINVSKGIVNIKNYQSPGFPKELSYMIFITVHVFPEDFFVR